MRLVPIIHSSSKSMNNQTRLHATAPFCTEQKKKHLYMPGQNLAAGRNVELAQLALCCEGLLPFACRSFCGGGAFALEIGCVNIDEN